MTMPKTTTSTDSRDLVLRRVIDAPREKVFKAWTEPALIKQWFAPLPWTTPVVEVDVRVGGSSLIVMRGPDGSEFPNRGVYLEVVRPTLRACATGQLLSVKRMKKWAFIKAGRCVPNSSQRSSKKVSASSEFRIARTVITGSHATID